MPQDPDILISDQTKFYEARKQRQFSTPDFPPRLQGDELVAWVRSGMLIEQAVSQHELVGVSALMKRGLTLEEWQIDPDGHILPRQSEPSSSGTTPPPATGESTLHPDH
jgi:hypothetical protein